jgi:hypothetical protein
MYVFRNFIWILGLSIILVTLSYQEYLSHIPNGSGKGVKLWKKNSFKKPFYLGSALTFAGISLTIDSFLPAFLAAVLAVLSTWALFKIFKVAKSKIT